METGIPIPERTTEGIVEWLNREIVRRSGAKLRRRGAGRTRGEEASRGDGAGERHRRRGRARGDGVGGIVPCLLVREYDGNGNSDNEKENNETNNQILSTIHKQTHQTGIPITEQIFPYALER